MSRYLIVMHQTALSPNLQRTVRALVTEDPAAEFAVLVPEALGVPLTWEGETVDVARQRAEAAKTLLEETAQARVFRAAVGAPEPLQAITDELQTPPSSTRTTARWGPRTTRREGRASISRCPWLRRERGDGSRAARPHRG